MDRGNRTLPVASALLAIPLALVIGSQSAGAPPTIGKQPAHRNVRPGGLLKVLSSGSSSDRQQKSSGAGVFSGLVEALRNDDPPAPTSRSHRSHHQRTHNHNHAQHRAQPKQQHRAQPKQQHHAQPKQQRANWDGVPYHQPHSAKNRVANVPMRDPATGSSPVIRSTPRTIKATPASARQETAARPAARREPSRRPQLRRVRKPRRGRIPREASWCKVNHACCLPRLRLHHR